MIGIIDYGMGNLRSVEKAFEHLGFQTLRIRTPEELRAAGKLVLPGVGTFGQAVENLRSQRLFDAIGDEIAAGKPMLGLCLGLQLLFDTSEEFGAHEGLGILRGKVCRLPEHLQVPHIGWNQVRQVLPDPLFEDVPDGSYFYFLHSYYADPALPEVVVATSDNGLAFPAVVRRENLIAAQFHPEKSQRVGLRFLENFARSA